MVGSNDLSIARGVAVTGAVAMWSRIVGEALDRSAWLLPPGSKIVEVGYGDGLLTCYLARTYGWNITGLDILPDAQRGARRHAAASGVARSVDFRLVAPEETWRHTGRYDGVFIKTVLYNAATRAEYGRWLDWVVSVLAPAGVFINFENGRTNRLTQWYRRLRKRPYTDLCLYAAAIESLYRERFPAVDVRYYGSVSQFLAPLPLLYRPVAFVEERLLARNADNSFIAAVVARTGRGTSPRRPGDPGEP